MRCTASAFALVTLVALSTTASAEVVWMGDFETGDTSQFSGRLNETVDGRTYINIVQDPVIQRANAARIELHDDARWPNGLRRVELNHRPADGRTAEGAETYFAWSFFLPETLSSDPSQTIGYWESNSSYRQMMAFQLSGEDLRFVTRQPQNTRHWDGTGVVTPQTWHRIAMRILWSKDENIGRVSVWFDGELVVDDVAARTLNDDNAHFTQIGLLRGDIDFSDVPIIIIDDAVEGDTLRDVRPDLPQPVMEPEPTDMGNTDMGPDSGMVNNGNNSNNTNPTNNANNANNANNSNTVDMGETNNGSPDSSGAGDEGCSMTGRPSQRLPELLLFALVLVGYRRRQRPRR